MQVTDIIAVPIFEFFNGISTEMTEFPFTVKRIETVII